MKGNGELFNLGDRKGHVSGANNGLLVLRNEMWRETELFFVCCAPFGAPDSSALGVLL